MHVTTAAARRSQQAPPRLRPLPAHRLLPARCAPSQPATTSSPCHAAAYYYSQQNPQQLCVQQPHPQQQPYAQPAYAPSGYAAPAPPKKPSLCQQIKAGKRPAWLEGLTWGIALS